jgi:hypothetical protein
MDHHASHQVAIASDYRSILEHHARADAGSLSDPDALAHHGGRVDSWLESPAPQLLPDNGEGIARIAHPQHARIKRKPRVLEASIGEDRSGLRRERTSHCLFIHGKHDGPRPGGFDAGDLRDLFLQQWRAYSEPVGNFAYRSHQ